MRAVIAKGIVALSFIGLCYFCLKLVVILQRTPFGIVFGVLLPIGLVGLGIGVYLCSCSLRYIPSNKNMPQIRAPIRLAPTGNSCPESEACAQPIAVATKIRASKAPLTKIRSLFPSHFKNPIYPSITLLLYEIIYWLNKRVNQIRTIPIGGNICKLTPLVYNVCGGFS